MVLAFAPVWLPLSSPGQVPFQLLKSFGFPGQSGGNSRAPLVIGADGALYGTTTNGGINYAGTVFKMNTDGSGHTNLHSFSTNDGEALDPEAGLIQGRDGALYGTSCSGGSSGYGTVFKLNTDGTGYTILHSFGSAGADGKFPCAGLMQGTIHMRINKATLVSRKPCRERIFVLSAVF